jgi:hypothetical protein
VGVKVPFIGHGELVNLLFRVGKLVRKSEVEFEVREEVVVLVDPSGLSSRGELPKEPVGRLSFQAFPDKEDFGFVGGVISGKSCKVEGASGSKLPEAGPVLAVKLGGFVGFVGLLGSSSENVNEGLVGCGAGVSGFLEGFDQEPVGLVAGCLLGLVVLLLGGNLLLLSSKPLGESSEGVEKVVT